MRATASFIWINVVSMKEKKEKGKMKTTEKKERNKKKVKEKHFVFSI